MTTASLPCDDHATTDRPWPLQDIVAANNDSVDAWYDYGCFCLRMHDVPKASECLREAVSISATHVPSLQVR